MNRAKSFGTCTPVSTRRATLPLFRAQLREEEHNGTYVGSLDALESGRKIHAGSRAIYAPPGYLLSVREETLWAQPFDAQRWEKTGSPIPIAAPVGSDLGHGNFSVSSERVLAYSTSPTRRSQLIWFDRQGQQISVVPAPEGSQNPALSPDGTRLAVDCPDTNTGASDIWLIELSKGTFSRFTFEVFRRSESDLVAGRQPNRVHLQISPSS